MKSLIIISALFLSASLCFASGWNDFDLDIGDGYQIVRCNSLDVLLRKTNGPLLINPDEYNKVGPIVRYINTPDYIFTMNYGKKIRNLFEGDTFQDVDSEQSYFFILKKGNDEITGPLSQQEFETRPEVAALMPISWQVPKNPNFWLPFFGMVIFIAISIPILAIKYFWITIPVFFALFFIARYINKNRKQIATKDINGVNKKS